MTRWARGTLVWAGLCAALGLSIFLLWPATIAPRVAENQTTFGDAAALEQQRIASMADELAKNFPDAPQDVTDIARIIIAGDVPLAAAIAALGDERLNQSWSKPYPDILPDDGHSLLRQAVQSRNLAAAAALIKAGADTAYNENEMPFAAVQMEDRGDRMYWFPDYRRGNALLALWLNAGGDVNAARYPGSALGTLLASTSDHNLEGILMLLAAGADPWLTIEMTYSEGEGGYTSESWALLHADASIISSEVAFRVARLGYYRNGPPEKVAELILQYDRTAQQYLGTSGPENLHIVWCLQKVLPLILEQTGQPATPDIAALLAMKVPEGIGGFFLGPNETRSAEVPAQEVNNTNQTGTVIWND